MKNNYIIILFIFALISTFVIISIINKINNSKIENYLNFKINNNQTINYHQFKKYYPKLHYANLQNKKNIPKFIFRTSKFKLSEIPKEIKDVLDKTIDTNPSYLQVYFDDDDIEEFIKEYYPKYYDLYITINPGAFKADIFRLLVIYRYGGIYNDIGHKYLVSIDEMIKEDEELILVIEPHDCWGIYNGMIGAYKNHPVILLFIEHVMNNVKDKYYGIDSTDITGPKAVGRALNKYFNNSDDVFWVPQEIINFNDNKINCSFRHYFAEGDEGYIVDKDFKPYVTTKFPNYYEIMYPTKKQYHNYWLDKNVYKEK